MKLAGMPGKVTLPAASLTWKKEWLPIHITLSTPAPVKAMDFDPVMTSASPKSTFFIPMVETKGCGRSRRVSSVPFKKPIRVLTSRPAMMRTKGFVIP